MNIIKYVNDGIIYVVIGLCMMGVVLLTLDVFADAGMTTCSDGSTVSSGQSCLKTAADQLNYLGDKTGLPKGSGSSPISTILVNIIKFVSGLVGGLAVLMIVAGGIIYISSSGDSAKTETAKKIIIYAIVGLIVSLLAWIIVDVIITNIK